MFFTYRLKSLHIGHTAAHVYGHYAPGFVSDRVFHRVGTERKCVIDIHQNRYGANTKHSFEACNKGEAGDYHFVAVPDAKRSQCRC